MLLLVGIIALVIGVDQLTKWIVVTHIPLGESVTVIPNVFRFTYIQNEGAAFGMLANHRWVFMVLSTVAILALLAYLFYRRKDSKWLTVPLALIIGGGISNMIDRFALKYVVDFLDFCAFPKLWKWIFNVADACVVVAAFILGFYLISLIVKEAQKKANGPQVGTLPVSGEESDDSSMTEDGDEAAAKESPEDDSSDESGTTSEENHESEEFGEDVPEEDDHTNHE